MEVLVESLGVLFPAQVITLAGAVRGAVLGILALTSMCPNSVFGTSRRRRRGGADLDPA